MVAMIMIISWQQVTFDTSADLLIGCPLSSWDQSVAKNSKQKVEHIKMLNAFDIYDFPSSKNIKTSCTLPSKIILLILKC